MKLREGNYVEQVTAKVLSPCQVVVAGGGTAGCVAAIAAARNGAKVMLVERGGYLGGMLTGGNAGLTMYTKFSGQPEENAKDQATLAENPRELQIVGGIVMEIAERLLSSGFGIGNCNTAGKYIFTSSEDFKRLLIQMTQEVGVKLRLHSWVTGVVQEGDELQGLVIESKSGREVIPATVFIDATGDGDVAARSGVPFTVGVTSEDLCAKTSTVGKMTDMGVMYKVGNVDLPRTFEWLAGNPECFLKQPFARFTLEQARERFQKGEMAVIIVVRKNTPPPNWFQIYNLPTPGVVTLCCPSVADMDGCDADDLTRSEVIMADMIGRWTESVKQIPGFENSFLLDVPEMGVRETRHIHGDYVLNLEDIYHQKKFDDCIGFGSHPIDSYPRPEWINNPETAYPPRWFFQIPFRSLIAKGKKNLLVVGRCMSATHEAFGCIRPTVQCMITGEAAGTAAALCVEQNLSLRELDIQVLRRKLREQKVLC